jgi:uncharacterized membrane protein
MTPVTSNSISSRVLGTLALVAVGTLSASTCIQTWLSSRELASNFISHSTWFTLANSLPQSRMVNAEQNLINIPLWVILVPCGIVGAITWLAGAIWLVLRRKWTWSEAVIQWGWYGWLCWCAVDLWEWLWIAAGTVGLTSVAGLMSVTPQFWLAGCLAGWMTAWLTLDQDARLAQPAADASKVNPRWLWLACGVYIIVFTTMNWRLYSNLLVPHGDSVMYEEHLWNLLHGKGFRSYLDRGLFLGEHIQFVHLFLIPLYVLWPSHLLLEACSSTALALGAFPVYWMTRRHTGSDRTGLAVAIAYLLYFPMQFLDIEIDLKTFRPESFGIPLLLMTLDQLDRKNLVGTLVGIGLCLTVKEDYTLIFGPLGIWIALRHFTESDPQVSPQNSGPRHRKSQIAIGLSLTLFSVGYLWLATRVIMPWFRSGDEVHYASYFSRFGKTPEEILHTWLTRPLSVMEVLLTTETSLYAIALLAPLAFLPLIAPARLAVGLPLFAILCMNELEGSRTPQHQFHAPLVAIVFWSLAAALPRASAMGQVIVRRLMWKHSSRTDIGSPVLRRLVLTSSLATGMFFSLCPLGMPFWNAGSSWHWRRLYGPTHRSEMFARIANLIPKTARVASTDFVHPRYTHYERSYDYSEYWRKVAGDGNRVPDDTEYIVIDTDHKYSKIKQPMEVPELRDHPDKWELLPDQTDGVFIVIMRKKKDAE